MGYKELKKGTFRWRKKFRYLPNREELIEELGIEWLANRMYGVIYKHMSMGGELQLLRIREYEFVYIVHIHEFFTSLEIIQKEPKREHILGLCETYE